MRDFHLVSPSQLLISVAYLEAASQKPSSIDTRPLPPIPGNSFTAPQENVAYAAASNQNLHSTSDPYDYAYVNQTVSTAPAACASVRALQGNVTYGTASSQNLRSTTWEEHIYQPISLARRDEASDYMQIFPVSKVKEQTDSITSSKVDLSVSSNVNPTAVDSTASSKVDLSVSSNVNPTEVDSTASSKVDLAVSSNLEVNSIASSKVNLSKANLTLPTDLSELTMEHFADADPRQAQLWMLLQIQKMVQKMEKMEDLYESVYLRAPSPLLTTTTATEQPAQPPATSADNLQPPNPIPPITTATEQPGISAGTLQPSDPNPSPPVITTTMEQPPPATESTDLEYYQDASSIIVEKPEKQQPSPETKVEPKMPTRKEIYINLGGTQKKATYKPLLPSPGSPPPAIPPKTYKKVSYVQVKESNLDPGDSSRPRQQQAPAQRCSRQESQIIEEYKNVPQQEMIGRRLIKLFLK